MSSFGRVVDTVAPPRLGTGFRWLLSSSWVSALGDGLSLAAGPLLVASQTHQPFLVALAALLQRLPWLLFGLYAGALADRIDRRRMVILWDGLRVVVLAFLAVTVATGWVDITVVLVVMFLVGLAEVFADSASRTLLPMLVHRDDLCTARDPTPRSTMRSSPAARPGRRRKSRWSAAPGDCLAPRYLADAIFDGHRIARELERQPRTTACHDPRAADLGARSLSKAGRRRPLTYLARLEDAAVRGRRRAALVLPEMAAVVSMGSARPGTRRRRIRAISYGKATRPWAMAKSSSRPRQHGRRPPRHCRRRPTGGSGRCRAR